MKLLSEDVHLWYETNYNQMLKRFQVFTFIICFCLSCTDDDYLDGYNRDALFAQPSQSELDAVVADWESRDLSLQN